MVSGRLLLKDRQLQTLDIVEIMLHVSRLLSASMHP
jgi:hypothetical protein